MITEYALAQLWRSWGIEPELLLGHSVGELAAACVAGVFSLEDGLTLVAARGQLMGALPQEGEMVSLLAAEARVREAIAPYSDELSIAAINGPASVVISGSRDAVLAVSELLAAEGVKSQRLTVSHAFHSPLMEPMLEAFDARFAKSRERQAAYAKLRDVEPFTRCGTRITVMMNAGLRDDMPSLALTGADGVGLFRTEFQFLVSATLPARERQTRLYRDVLEAAGDKPVVFRTVDIGGDKVLPYLRHNDGEQEENPAMGWRALRVALERDGLLKVQARALLEAAAGRTLNVMFPMVTEPWEFDAARQVFENQRAYLKGQKKLLPDAIRYGAMLEVPALAEQLDVLAPKLSFLSIGTNDLTQFLFAADRANPKLAERYDWLSPAILRFLKRVMQGVAGHDVDVTVCGEMGGRRLEALALLGIGIHRLSITPASVGPIKELVRKVDLGEIGKAMTGWLHSPPPSLREALLAWAQERGIDCD